MKPTQALSLLTVAIFCAFGALAHAETTNPEVVAQDAGSQAGPSSEDLAMIKSLKLEKKLQRLQKAMSRSSRKPLLRRLTVRGDQLETADFEHKGSELYVAYAHLPAGKQLVEINGKDYDLDLAEAKAEYVLLFNNSKPQRPKLTVFKKDLLEWVDSPL